MRQTLIIAITEGCTKEETINHLWVEGCSKSAAEAYIKWRKVEFPTGEYKRREELQDISLDL